MVLEHFIAGKSDIFSAAEDYPLQPLEDDCNLLGTLLDKCLEIEIGADLFKKYNRLRALSDSSSRLSTASDPDAAAYLAEKMSKELMSMPLEEALPVVRAFGHYLNLTSIAEVHHSVRTTRMDGMKVQTADEIYLHLLESGVAPEALYDSVVKESVEIVLTAHPTQVNRRTLQHKLTQIAQLLAEKDGGRLTEEEQAANLDAIRREITALWQTDELRRRKPTPLDEARGGLHIVEQSLWAAVPDHLRRIDAALRKHTGRELPINATPIRFGSWMGGDRDGNPNVTAKVTHDVACLARWMAADLYLKEIDALRFELSMSHASDEVWRMARAIVARLADDEGPTVASTAAAAAAVAKSPSGELPRPIHDHATGKTLIRGESFTVEATQLASLLGRRSLDGGEAGGIISPPVGISPLIMSPRNTPETSFASENIHNTGTSAAAVLMQTNGGGGGGAGGMYNPGSPRAARAFNAQGMGNLTKATAGAPFGMKKVDTKGSVLDPERLKQRGNQAARYHKSSIDNLIHPRAAGAAPYRILLGEVRAKLVNTRRRMEDLLAGIVPDENAEWYENEEEFLIPLMACYWSLWECGGGVIADGRLLDLLRRIHCFGLALMKMDLRQESTRHSDTLNEVTEHLGLGSYNEWDEDKRLEWLVGELEGRRPLIPPAMPFSEDAKEVLDTLKLATQLGRQSLGAYVISMATRASDVLAVELLQREAKMMSLVDAGVHAKNPSAPPAPGTAEHKKTLPLRVVPLFETLTDLDAAGGVMTRLMNLPWYRQHVKDVHDDHQEVMLGYSDSGKDAGRLAAAWALYACQEDLVKVCKEAGVKLTLFHGRGGTIGRGGGPMLLAIQSQPPGSVQGSIRITEQGEMVQAKFGVPAVARRQLEIYNNAVLLATLDPPKPPKDESWRQVMDSISKSSCAAYRAVVFEDPMFIRYFQHATPQEELANLNIGSRPARRKAGGDVTTLRAIPWIFAWTQTRMVLPSWLGVADGIAAVVNDGKRNVLKDMYEHWPFFQSVVDLIEMVLTKADMRIASLYDQHLVTDPSEQALGDALRRRYIDTVRSVLSITGHARLGDNNPTLRYLIAMRNPHVDPLNVMQVEILRRLRGDDTNQSLRDALLITINGIAAGMVWSGKTNHGRNREATKPAFAKASHGAAVLSAAIFLWSGNACASGVYGFFDLGMPWWQVGLMIATYQICRAIANLLIPLVGKIVYHILGVCIGLAGYAIHSSSQQNRISLFWAAVAMIGFSEVITCMQHYIKVEYVQFGVPVFRQRLRLQYACNVAGTAVGFIVSGFLLDLDTTDDIGDVNKDGYWGIALQSCELLSTLTYIALVKFWPTESAPTHDFAQLLFATEAEKALVMGEENKETGKTPLNEISLTYLNRAPPKLVQCAISLPANEEVAANEIASLASLGVVISDEVHPKELERVMSKKTPTTETDNNGVPWINYMIVATFAIQALCIGVILSTAPILLLEEYDFDVRWIGLVFGCGEILGTIALFSFVPVSTQMKVRRYFPGPLNVLIIVGSLGILAVLLVINTLGSSVAFILLIMGLNDFGTALTAEAQGATVASENYSRMNALSNIGRRVGNTVTAAVGPIMYGVVYYLPFVTFGGLTVLWILVMAIAFNKRGHEVAAMIKENGSGVIEEQSTGLQFYLRSQTFITSELNARKKSAEN